MDGWNQYAAPPNIDEEGSWLDYPHIGYNEENLVIAANLFVDGQQLSDISRVFMFDLNDGYNNNALEWAYFSDIEYPNNNSAFTLCPVSFPYGSYGPGTLLVNRRDDDSMGLWYITDNLSGDPTLDSYSHDAPQRDYPIAAPQANVANTLDVGSKIQHAFYMGDGQLFYSMTCSDSDGDNRLVVGLMDTGSGAIEDSSFGLDGWDYAYPWVLPWAGNFSVWNGELVVAFLSVSSTTFPQFRAVRLDTDPSTWEWSSSSSIRSGSSAINAAAGQNRWGDYNGGWIREWSSQPEVWVYGQYGANNDHAMWTAQLLEDIMGCTDSEACNYDSAATADDGSCQYTSCAGCMDAAACNYDSGATIDDDSCTYPGCNSFGACNYSFAAGCDDGSCCFNTCVEMTMGSWSISPFGGLDDLLSFVIIENLTNDTIASGGNFFSTTYDDCLEAGCYTLSVTGDGDVDWNFSYDPFFFIIGADLTIFSGTGPFQGVFIIGDGGESGGCMDAEACNFEPGALCDNGSCCYDHCVTVEMTDTFGDGWNGCDWKVTTADGVLTVAYGTLEDGSYGEAIACLEPDCYRFYIDISSGQFPNEVGWTLTGINGGDLSGTAADEVWFSVGEGGDNVGCTDPDACNYSSIAYCDNGTCCFSNCGELTLEDTFGDGWNGADLTLGGPSGDMSTYTLNSGALETMEVCLVDGCYHLDVTSGSWPSEISWTLLFTNNYLIGGGAPFSQDFGLNAVFGCTDPFSCDYNAAATCDDGTCTYPGCMDETACNYQPGAICQGDVICDFSCHGCTYETAINYEPDATQDDGSCIFPTPSDCAADINWDGMVSVADVLELLGAFGSGCE
jgi:hypothetical protein